MAIQYKTKALAQMALNKAIKKYPELKGKYKVVKITHYEIRDNK